MFINLLNRIRRCTKDEGGQGMVEYALIIGLVAVLLIAGLTLLKDQIASVFSSIVTALT